ncbi:MAG TPA: flavin reductase family protein [Candidatus Sulfopaludibacter sp.]|nr:flavin reductase family protein [Candidatus Sulfopaludibacter sp.]
MTVDPQTARHIDIYKLMIGSIVPRPIALVSTVSDDGIRNLAPFSFFTGISSKPAMICFCPGPRAAGAARKDTLENISRTKEFVVNIVSEEIAEAMNLTAGEYPPDTDEFAIAGLTAIPSDLVRPPRVAESHVNMECRLYLSIEFSELPGGGNLVIGEVLRFHVDDRMVDNFKIDPDQLRAVGRMGGPTGYTRTRDRFDMIRPKV